MTARRLASLTFTEYRGAPPEVLIVPLGATEQHGPHLSLGTDTILATCLADALAARLASAVAAPALPYGSSGEHAGFDGTLSIGQDALEELLVELIRSSPDSLGLRVLVSGHGGNAEPARRAATRCCAEGRRTLAWFPRVQGGDAHAGRTETSLMLAIAPQTVRTERAEPGDGRPLSEMIDELRAGGVAAVATNGVLGDPAGASPAEGRRLFDLLVDDLVAAVNGALDEALRSDDG